MASAGSFRPDADGHAVIAVPGTATLTAVEEHVDYAGLPPVQREMLEDLCAAPRRTARWGRREW